MNYLPTSKATTTYYPLPILQFGVKKKCCKKYKKKKGKHCKRCPEKQLTGVYPENLMVIGKS